MKSGDTIIRHDCSVELGMLCGIFQKEVFHWILSDEMIIARAGDYLWMIVLLVLVKIPYRIRLLYLQGNRKRRAGLLDYGCGICDLWCWCVLQRQSCCSFRNLSDDNFGIWTSGRHLSLAE